MLWVHSLRNSRVAAAAAFFSLFIAVRTIMPARNSGREGLMASPIAQWTPVSSSQAAELGLDTKGREYYIANLDLIERAISMQSHDPELLIPFRSKLTRFRMRDSKVMAPELAAKFPEIHSYVGSSVDEGVNSGGQFDINPSGVHAQIRGGGGGAYYVEPVRRPKGATGIWIPGLHVAYDKSNIAPPKHNPLAGEGVIPTR